MRISKAGKRMRIVDLAGKRNEKRERIPIELPSLARV
jgi:hypothetical protein